MFSNQVDKSKNSKRFFFSFLSCSSVNYQTPAKWLVHDFPLSIAQKFTLLFCTNNFRPNVRRRLESSVNTEPVMVLPSVRWWRRSKSPSTENTPAHSAERTPWSALVLESGHANDASESLPVEHGFTQQPPLPQWDQPSVVSVNWLKHPTFWIYVIRPYIKTLAK